MKLPDYFSSALKAMRERKLRTILTLLGIVIGPATMVSLSATMLGFNSSINHQISKLGASTLLVMPSSGHTLTVDDADALVLLDHVKRSVPFYLFRGIVPSGGQPYEVNIFAIDSDSLFDIVRGMKVAKGTIPDPSDTSSTLVGWLVAHPEDPTKPSYEIGDVVTVSIPVSTGMNPKYKTRSFVVVGIMEEFGPAFFLNPDNALFVPFEAGRSIKGGSAVSGIVVQADDVAHVDTVEGEIREAYAGTVEVYSIKVLLNVVNSILSGINFLTMSVASVSLLVAFVGIMTTMFTSVVERTREIGLLKALGFTSNEILGLFLSEAAITGLLGGVLGAVVGVVVAYARVYMRGPYNIGEGFVVVTKITPVFTPENIAFAIALAFLVGIAAGLIPAYRASRMEPVKALRYE